MFFKNSNELNKKLQQQDEDQLNYISLTLQANPQWDTKDFGTPLC